MKFNAEHFPLLPQRLGGRMAVPAQLGILCVMAGFRWVEV